MLKWNKVQISEMAISTAANINKISEEDALDYLLELLENAPYAILKESFPTGTELYRLENDYLFVNEMFLVNYSKRRDFSRKIKNEVHKAEDGRCEKCGRPMDKRAVTIQRIDPTIFNDYDNYALFCPDCSNGEPDPLQEAKFDSETIARYQMARNISFEEAHKELIISKNNFVLINKEEYRIYWAPGLGSFFLIGSYLRCRRLNRSPIPILERKPQERSRRWSSEVL